MLHSIGGRPVGASAPVFVIAEIGLNHGGSVERALALVDGAAGAGASAIKLQTIAADRLVAPSCPAPAHVTATSLRDFFAGFELSIDAHRAVVSRARERGLAVMTTPFAVDLLPMLEPLGFDAYKIASGDLTYPALVAAAAATRRPLVISTGMSTLSEIESALRAAAETGNDALALLHCVSAYPAPPEAQNLLAIRKLSDRFRLPTGLSDHGGGLVSAVTAVALGAVLYERHLVLDGDDNAIDRAVSSTPAELCAIIQAMEEARRCLGTGRKVCQPAEAVNVTASRRGLYASRALRAGERLTPEDIIALRPETSVRPAEMDRLVGTIVGRDVAAGEPFRTMDVPADGQVTLDGGGSPAVVKGQTNQPADPAGFSRAPAQAAGGQA